MQNTLLVGLSRQVVLERQMDVVANNVANINTSGYKADRSLFQEYLASNAHEDNFATPDRRVSFVQDRATFHDFSAGPDRRDQEPARRRDRRRGLPRGADPGRRALHPRRRPADQQPGPARHRLRLPGARQFRPDRVPADRSRHQHCRRRQRHRSGRHRPHRLGPRQAAHGLLRAGAAAREGRLQPLFGRRPARPPRPTPPRGCARASSRSRTSIPSPK